VTKLLRWVLSLPMAGLLIAAPLPDAPDLLPDDTLVMATVPNATSARRALADSPWGQLWADAAMRSFRTNFEAGFEHGFAAGFEKQTGVKPAELFELLRGQITVAMLRDQWTGEAEDGSAPAWLLIADSQDQTAKLQALFARARQRQTQTPAAILKIRGHDFLKVVMGLDAPTNSTTTRSATADKSDDDAEEEGELEDAPGSLEFAVGTVDSVLLAGTSPGVIERMIERLGAVTRTNALSGSAAYQKARDAVLSEGELRVFADVGAIYRQFAPSLSSLFGMLQMLGADPAKVGGALGLDALGTLALRVQPSTNGVYAETQLSAPAERRRGLSKLLEVRTADAGIPPFVPAHAVQFQRWRLDGAGIWKTIDGALNAMSPQISGLARLTVESAGQVFEPNFNLLRDLVANLGSDFMSYSLPPSGTNLVQLAEDRSVQLIATTNPPGLMLGLKALAALKFMQSGALSFVETTNGPNRMVTARLASKGATHTAFQLATTTNMVAVSSDAAALIAFLEGHTNSLKTLPGLDEAAVQVGGTTNGMFGLEVSRELLRPRWDVLRDAGSMRALMPGGVANSDAVQALQQWADFRLLPPFEPVSRYFTPSVSSLGVDAAGYRFRWFLTGVK
jgi:hypothetical protein